MNDQYQANAEVSTASGTQQEAAFSSKNPMGGEATLNLPPRCHDCPKLEWERSSQTSCQESTALPD